MKRKRDIENLRGHNSKEIKEIRDIRNKKEIEDILNIKDISDSEGDIINDQIGMG